MVINIESLALVPLLYSFQSNEDLSIKVVIISEFSNSRITQPINENGIDISETVTAPSSGSVGVSYLEFGNKNTLD